MSSNAVLRSDREVNDIKTFVFIDLETTGLPSEGKPRITEICLVSIHKHILQHWQNLDEVPRVINKYVSVICPMKPVSKGASDITGLYNEDLEYQKDFDPQLVESIRLFLERHEKPICLVAHNGLKFDFSLLRSEYESVSQSFPDDLLCMDTLVMCRELEEGKDQPKAESCVGEKSQLSKEKLDELFFNLEVPIMVDTTPEKRSVARLETEEDNTDITPLKKVKTDDNTSAWSGAVKVNRALVFSSGDGKNLEADMEAVQKSENSSMKGSESRNSHSTSSNSCSGYTQNEQCSNTDDKIESHISKQGFNQSGTLDPGESQGMVDFLTDLISTGQFESLESFGSEGYVTSERDIDKGDTTKASEEHTSSFPEGEDTTFRKENTSKVLEANEVNESEQGIEERERQNFPVSVVDCKVSDEGISGKLEIHSKSKTCNRSPPIVQRVATLGRMSSEVKGTSETSNVNSAHVCQTPVTHTAPETNRICSSHNIDRNYGNTTQYKRYKNSYKLLEVHKRVVGSYPVNSHTAEDDSIALLRICQKLAPAFIEWANRNAVPINTVEPMYPKSPKKRKVLETGTLAYNT